MYLRFSWHDKGVDNWFMIILPPTTILIWKSECKLINLQMEKNLAWDCEFTQKNAWQFRRFLGEYRIRAGCPQGTVLSSLGSLMNCLSCPKRRFCVKSQTFPVWAPTRWAEQRERPTPAPQLSPVMLVVTCLCCCIGLSLFHFTSFCNSLHLTSLQISFN